VYVARSRSFSLRLLLVACVLGFVTLVACLFLITLPELQRVEKPFIWSAQDPRVLASSGLVANMATLTVGLIFATLGLSKRFGQCLNYEYIWLVLSVSFSFNLIMTRTYTAVYLAGPSVDPMSIWLHDPVAIDGVIFLAMDMLVTLMCLCGVMRVHLLLIAVACAVLISSLSLLVFGVSEATVLPATIVILLCLGSFACLGAWRNEGSDRREWLHARTILEQQSHLQDYTALASGMTAIAERLCDLVFRLGPDWCFCDDLVAHESFFGQPMLGVPFVSIVAPSDHERFQGLISRASSSQIPQCMPITLLRASKSLEVEMLVVEIASQQQQYIIGIRMDAGNDGSHMHLQELPDEPYIEDIISGAAPEIDPVIHPRPESIASTTVTGTAFDDLAKLRADLSTDEGPEAFRECLLAFVSIGCREHWIIPSADVRLFPELVLGKGGYGTVIVASVRGTAMAIKVPRDPASGFDSRFLASAANELRIHRHIRHPNIAHFYGACVDPCRGDLALLFELVQGTNLDDFIKTRNTQLLEQRIQLKVLLDVTCALQYLHLLQPQVVHGDLKPENVMVQTGKHGLCSAKLLDLGLACMRTKRALPRGLTRRWAAPEVRQKLRPAASSDVFSFGLIIHFVMAGGLPSSLPPKTNASATRPRSDVTAASSSCMVADLGGKVEGSTMDVALHALYSSCISWDPSLRPSMEQVRDAIMKAIPSDFDVTVLGLEVCVTACTGSRGVSWEEARVAFQDPPASQCDRPALGGLSASGGERRLLKL